MQVKTGDYIIKYFNSHGSEVKQLRELEDSFTQAVELGSWYKDDPKKAEAASFTVDKKLYDSLDTKEVWR